MARQAVPAYNPLETIVLDRTSPVPLYFQLAQHYENEIHSGNLDSGDRLENEVKIAEELGLSRPTVRAAFRYLVDKDLVRRQRGQGTVVTKEKVNRNVDSRASLTTSPSRARDQPRRCCTTRRYERRTWSRVH